MRGSVKHLFFRLSSLLFPAHSHLLSNKIPDIVGDRILQLLQEGYFNRDIVKVLKSDGINVAHSNVSNVNRKVSRQRNFEEKIEIHRKRPAQKSSLVKQVVGKVDIDDPPSQRAIENSVKVSQSIVWRIITNAGFVLRTKRKVQKRCQRARRLYHQLANGKSKLYHN